MIRVFTAAALALSLSFAAPAQAETVPNIAGSWTFTAKLPIECSFGGNAFFEKVGENKFKGELTANQDCPGLDAPWVVRQSCEASMLGKQVSVRCTIAEFVNGFESRYYYPDNFTLTAESSQRMFGALVSAGDANPAEWIRNETGIS